jgi:hypothetical protein
VDADCRALTPSASCKPGSTTKNFGIVAADGNFYKLDPSSDSKIRACFPDLSAAQDVVVTGRMEGMNTIAVDTIQPRAAGSAAAQSSTSQTETMRPQSDTATAPQPSQPETERAESDASATSQKQPGAAEGKGQTYRGTLFDAVCREQTPQAACTPGPKTTSFGLLTEEDKFYKIAPESNSKILDVLRSRPERSASDASANSPVKAEVTGTLSGETLTVETIELR